MQPEFALFTDWYELTMDGAYQCEAVTENAAFELFYRRLPDERNFIIAAGIHDVVRSLPELRFSDDDLAYLRRQHTLPESFIEGLSSFRFTGDVYAVREGTAVFPHEPIVKVVAPMIEAQLIETLVLNQVHFQSVLASKAARVVLAADGRKLVDFGSRRAHGIDAALKAARASYLAGFAGSSNVLAGKLYDMPVYGTMAHSYIQAHENETEALAAFARTYPGTVLLVDTYDTLEGVRQVIALKHKHGDHFRSSAVRLDSGDLVGLAVESRRMLDEAGMRDVQIFASGGLDEYKIAQMLKDGAPIDGFGVGTKLTVAADAPYLDMAYKLVEYAGKPRFKLSESKEIYPGGKQVFRHYQADTMCGDDLAGDDESSDGRPLLRKVVDRGSLCEDAIADLAETRDYVQAEIRALPPELCRLEKAATPYPVRISDRLRKRRDELIAALRQRSDSL